MEMQIYLVELSAYYENPYDYLGEWFTLPVSENEVNERFGKRMFKCRIIQIAKHTQNGTANII